MMMNGSSDGQIDLMKEEEWILFHQSVRGHSHILRDTEGQDFSASYEDEEKRFQILAVADGHGDGTCMRSAQGARLAVQAAVEALILFAEEAVLHELNQEQLSIEDELLLPGRQRVLLHTLTDAILANWSGRVAADLEANPLTEEELLEAGEYRKSYEEGKHLERIYGTTLLAALHLPALLILIQQGDGRCVAIDQTGRASQPVPWDPACQRNVTTSVSDDDAAFRIRTAVIDLVRTPLAACFLGSDGIEDSFPDPEGTDIFFKNLSLELTGLSDSEERADYLEKELSDFSKNGSGDDISVAGYLIPEKIRALTRSFEEEIALYKRRVRMDYLRQKLSSMETKHQVLEKLAREESEAKMRQVGEAEAAYLDYHNKYMALRRELSEMEDALFTERSGTEGSGETDGQGKDSQGSGETDGRMQDSQGSGETDGRTQDGRDQIDRNPDQPVDEGLIRNWQKKIAQILKQEKKGELTSDEQADHRSFLRTTDRGDTP